MYLGRGRYGCRCKRGYQGDGRKTCSKPCVCTGSGDPHYRTFDGRWIHFMGRCTYVLTKSLRGNDPCKFAVHVKNHNLHNHKGKRRFQVSWTKFVEVHVAGHTVKLGQGRHVYLDGEHQQVPFVLKRSDFKVYLRGRFVRVESRRCGFKVGFDGRAAVAVMVHPRYMNRMKGICGNCNNRPEDDFMTSEGKDVSRQVNRYALLGNSFRVKGSKYDVKESNCDDSNDSWPTCSRKQVRKIQSRKYCGKLILRRGPFARCLHSRKVDVRGYFSACQFDICAYFEKPVEARQAMCRTLTSFAEECASKGYRADWRTVLNCPMKCGKNMKYSFVAKPCPLSCHSYTRGSRKRCAAGKSPREGCECRKGYVLSGNQCIKPEECGCKDAQGISRQLYTKWINKACSSQLMCYDTGKIRRVPMSCARNAHCTVRFGKRGCFCNKGFRGDGRKKCVDVNECRHIEHACHKKATCHNVPGSYRCRCRRGYIGSGFKCQDDNECRRNVCDRNARCRNTIGSYRCECKAGYRKDRRGRCVDVHECRIGRHRCHKYAKCVNKQGGYECHCNRGFKAIAHDRNIKDDGCTDVDECALKRDK